MLLIPCPVCKDKFGITNRGTCPHRPRVKKRCTDVQWKKKLPKLLQKHKQNESKTEIDERPDVVSQSDIPDSSEPLDSLESRDNSTEADATGEKSEDDIRKTPDLPPTVKEISGNSVYRGVQSTTISASVPTGKGGISSEYTYPIGLTAEENIAGMEWLYSQAGQAVEFGKTETRLLFRAYSDAKLGWATKDPKKYIAYWNFKKIAVLSLFHGKALKIGLKKKFGNVFEKIKGVTKKYKLGNQNVVKEGVKK